MLGLELEICTSPMMPGKGDAVSLSCQPVRGIVPGLRRGTRFARFWSWSVSWWCTQLSANVMDM
eukprot:8149518-Pyramimonas_sp.AAC.1